MSRTVLHVVGPDDPGYVNEYAIGQAVKRIVFAQLRLDENFDAIVRPYRDDAYDCCVCQRRAMIITVELTAHDEHSGCAVPSQHPWYLDRTLKVKMPWCIFCAEVFPTGAGCYHVDHHGEIIGINLAGAPMNDQLADG